MLAAQIKSFAFLAILLLAGMAIARWSFDEQAKRDCPWRLTLIPLIPVVGGYLSPNLTVYITFLSILPFALARTRAEVAGVMLALAAATPRIRFIPPYGDSLLFVANTTMFIVGAATIALMVKRGTAVRNLRPIDFAFVPIVLLVVVITSRGQSVATYARQFFTDGLLLGASCYVVLRAIRTREDMRKVMTIFLATAISLGVVALFEGLRTWPLYQSFVRPLSDTFEQSLTRAVRGGMLRTPGPFAEATSFGVFLAVTGLAAMAAPIFRTSNRKVAIVVLMTLAAYLTQSRGALSGMFVGGLALLWYRRRIGLAIGIAISAVMGYLFLYAVVPANSGLAETIGKSGVSVGTTDYRALLFRRGMEEFWKFPWIGRSLQAVQDAMPDLIQGQGIIDWVNTYIYLAVLSGIVGLATLGFVSWVTLQRTLPRPPASRRTVDYMWADWVFAGFLAMLTMLAGTSFFGSNRVWFILLIAFAAVTHRLRAPARAALRSTPADALPPALLAPAEARPA